MKLAHFVFLTGILVVQYSPIQAQDTTASRPLKTYKTFAAQKEMLAYHKTAKARYVIQRIPTDSITYGEEQSFMKAAPTARAETKGTESTESGVYYSNAEKCQSSVFAGHDRAVAKTHEYSGNMNEFSTFDGFCNSGLVKTDDVMLNHDPAITKDPESPRVKEEQVNVTIDEAYIYGIYREDDNDFHMIIGNGETGAKMVLFNAEVSGLPGDVNDQLLSSVRDKIITRFGNIACKSGAFKPVGTLIPIKITGSLFFDVDHKAGVVGFGIYKPKTAWEIHPITGLMFLDE